MIKKVNKGLYNLSLVKLLSHNLILNNFENTFQLTYCSTFVKRGNYKKY